MADTAAEPGQPGESANPTPARPPRSVLSGALLAILAYVAFDIGLPLIRLPLTWPPGVTTVIGLVIPTVIFMFLQLWLTRSVVRLRWPTGPTIAAAVVCIGLWFLVAIYVHLSHRMPISEIQTVILLKNAALGLLLTLGLTFLGILLSLIIREPNVLLPIALVAIPIDYVGAMTSLGFTQAVVQHAPQIVSAVSVPVPSIGTPHSVGAHPIGYIGPGDALFIACFFAAVQRLGLNERGTFWWVYTLLTIAMLVVLITGLNIAALVPMGVAVIVANFRYFRFQRSEVFAMVYAAIMVFVVVGAFYAASHHFLFRR